jgi:hypothetical protein
LLRVSMAESVESRRKGCLRNQVERDRSIPSVFEEAVTEGSLYLDVRCEREKSLRGMEHSLSSEFRNGRSERLGLEACEMLVSWRNDDLEASRPCDHFLYILREFGRREIPRGSHYLIPYSVRSSKVSHESADMLF